MIKLLRRDFRTFPILTCDMCHERIEDAGMAMVRFPTIEEGQTSTNIVFCHKLACDEALNQTAPCDGWMELTHFYVRLLHNSGMTPESIVAAQEGAERLDRF